jgi:hypothetical protein
MLDIVLILTYLAGAGSVLIAWLFWPSNTQLKIDTKTKCNNHSKWRILTDFAY